MDLKTKIIETTIGDEFNPSKGLTTNEPHKRKVRGIFYWWIQSASISMLTMHPNNAKLKKSVLDELHQVPYSTHPEYEKIVTATEKSYFYPGMKKDVADYIDRYDKFQ